MPAKGEQGPGVGPGGRAFEREPVEEPCQVVVAVEVQQPGGQRVPHSLVVVRVEPEHVLKLGDRLGSPPERPQHLGQPELGSHQRPGLEDPPEHAGRVLEEARVKRPGAGLNPFLVQRQGFLAAPGVLGQEHVGVGAVGGDRERLMRHGDLLVAVLRLERLVKDRLRPAEGRTHVGLRIARSPAQDVAHQTFQDAAVGKSGGGIPRVGSWPMA